MRARCRYCKIEKIMPSYDFWVGLWEKDPKVQADRNKAFQKINDAIREHMKKTGSRKVKLKRESKDTYRIEFE